MYWHLHVTVAPHWSWSVTDVGAALKQEIERHGIKPLVITNHFHDGRPSYRELIPSKHHEGNETSASREIFKMGVLLNNAGWRVRRLKIEGDPLVPSVAARALYFETHLKNTNLPLNAAPRSTSVKNTFHTIRLTKSRKSVVDAIYKLYSDHGYPFEACAYVPIEIEAAVLDTAPELDEDWITQCPRSQ